MFQRVLHIAFFWLLVALVTLATWQYVLLLNEATKFSAFWWLSAPVFLVGVATCIGRMRHYWDWINFHYPTGKRKSSLFNRRVDPFDPIDPIDKEWR